ncbi:unnamed protein product [Rotaria magnacalcarata]|uniref:Metallo-beta-lactamase domain-containing protein n=2 Tax=Rotaria magnacalcarata TaxID=392030 RepID=A0A815TW01_9BILA|nr:unnamed protein product [Rotaria magnacalcarata]CAF2059238.1 unnamed protein product [Rotaria magnacalcarata]CAF4070861.1 unnamed protein product [Rotaria magnacalcarata]CAF4319054.1 unnamed protein product [Rotaria magnacalcarata]CAF4443409.1 unnamed protein product [Rotaria magnacalcarata]
MGTNMSLEDSIDVLSQSDRRPTEDINVKVVQGISSYDIICLGVGKGATAVYSNQASSSFALLRRSTKECILLIDIGLGSIYALQKYLEKSDVTPRQIFVSHNHTDHSGELPVYIANETLKSVVQVYCYTGVQSRLRQHRCAELESSTTDLLKNVKWIMCDESQVVELDSGDPNSKLKIRVQRSQHSELCGGFVLYENDQAILGFSGDSGFNEEFFKFLWTAPTILVDGRERSTYEHASFDEILSFYKTTSTQRRVFVYHYGLENEKPTFPIESISAVIPGQVIQLMLPQ